MTELALFELMSEADCELLARSDVRVNVRRKMGMRIVLIAAILSTVLVATLFVGAFAAVRNFKENHPEIQGGLVEVLSVALADEDSILSEVLPENVKLELGELIVKLGGENPFTPLGPGESETETNAETETETESESESESHNDRPWHSECMYCGKLDGENRWFIARVIDSNVVKPIGDKCFEAVYAGDAGFQVNFLGDNPIEKQGLVAGDIVCVTYNGHVLDTDPCQIYPDSVEPFSWDTSEQTEAPFDYETLFDYEMQHKPTYADYLKIEIDMTVEEVVEILGKPHGTDAAAGSKYLVWEMAEGGSCVIKVVSLYAKEEPTEWSDILKPHYGGATVAYHYYFAPESAQDGE
ncbi:MAG: hypothetical protein E7594_03135 [Ruminococcaceae bacterium]|nr:hypothetical protein [Oscillospiraceae bacterium]